MERQGRPSWVRTDVKVTEPHDLVLAARSIIAARRVLSEKMPAGFAGEPALIILLDLFVEQESDRTRTLADLVAETGLASTAVARWCKALGHQGLVRFGPVVELTDSGMDLVIDMVAAVIGSQARLLGMPPIR
jgi:hypothetical protein